VIATDGVVICSVTVFFLLSCDLLRVSYRWNSDSVMLPTVAGQSVTVLANGLPK
jgi:hypothetical protein